MSRTYQPEYAPSTGEVRETFADEIAALGGEISDVFEDGARLFVRAVLPTDAEVLPGDRIRAGVAVRVVAAEITVHPYTFRQVCRNGAIAAHALPSRRLERTESTDVFLPTYDIATTLSGLRDAVRACAAREAFAHVTDELRSSAALQTGIALSMLSGVARTRGSAVAAAMLPQILERFAAGGDSSAYGLVNAVTSLARDTRDPATRWELEALGGALPARLVRPPSATPSASAALV